MHSRIGLPILCRVSAQPSQPLPPPPHPSLQPPDTFPCFCPALTFSSLQPFDAFLPAAHFPGRMASRTGRPAAFPGRVQFKRKLSKNRAEQRRTGGELANLCQLTDFEGQAWCEWGSTIGRPPVGVLNLVPCHQASKASQSLQAQQSLQAHQVLQASQSLQALQPMQAISGDEEARASPLLVQVLLSTEDSKEVEEEPAVGSSNVPAAIFSSTKQAVGPSSLQQGTLSGSMPAPTPQRMVRRDRIAPRPAEVNLDMVQMPRTSVNNG
uniref:uncharacterized protein isoform X2 n=1 Tax=Pristiophorus japonicus TaxID=55135 RepID=UPI00398E9FA3